MKKTLSKKVINGHVYFYLVYRKNGKLKTEYIGTNDSEAFKKYLVTLTTEGKDFMKEKALKDNPFVAIYEDGKCYRVYSSKYKEKISPDGRVGKFHESQ